MRQLRLRVLDAAGPGVDVFVARARGVARLAELQHEPEAADALAAAAARAARWRQQDTRPALYADLDAAHAALRYH